MSPNIFLSHSWPDKIFAKRLAHDLECQGIKCWLDEGEINIGDSLLEKIRDGIGNADYLAIALSPASVSSSWVQQEIEIALNQQPNGRKVKILPIKVRECDLPELLRGIRCADFTDEKRYDNAFEELVRSIGMVFNRKAHATKPGKLSLLGKLVTTLGLVTRRKSARAGTGSQSLNTAINKALKHGLRLMNHPFHRPSQYVGMTVTDASKQTGGTPNDVKNIVIETRECRMLLETEGNFISFVTVDLKETAPHSQSQSFDSEPLLGALSISLHELDLIERQTHCHTYLDHRRRLKVNVMCDYEGGPLSVSFSSKYYTEIATN